MVATARRCPCRLTPSHQERVRPAQPGPQAPQPRAGRGRAKDSHRGASYNYTNKQQRRFTRDLIDKSDHTHKPDYFIRQPHLLPASAGQRRKPGQVHLSRPGSTPVYSQHDPPPPRQSKKTTPPPPTHGIRSTQKAKPNPHTHRHHNAPRNPPRTIHKPHPPKTTPPHQPHQPRTTNTQNTDICNDST